MQKEDAMAQASPKDSANPKDSDYGVLDRADGRVTLRFTRRLAHSPQKVWRALTEPGHLAAWFPTTIDGERVAGAKLSFAFAEVAVPVMDGEMLAWDPPSRMELTWGDETLRFELAPDGDGTVLRLSASFDELGKAARDAAGWHSCLDLLAGEVSGQAPAWQRDDHWRQVHRVYVDRFGPEASTIGPPREWQEAHGAAGS
jgi:uncharacterized protein YndB with AHSA1/START domain